ncbi:PREDICTED: leucine-rich repeat, immunoglobulin-like domain and transmembrane domain-containing protein 3 [Nanorana parkeri]|uniref:leucine-rich repeat, immunoglobulin-like domain and transmembrane domain-containing protein 3 n=1 Tax=Nanorana parkeri TaxID=125878 RepID=UPI00085508C2|nr:PREDICTED: leucine-rich repeat, immunoglobulin-like domain and transmembrane domain-containing protein 3 [Nanorana parkeri]
MESSTLEAFCPSQCTCIFHGRSDGTGTRSVLCNDPDMFDIPVNVPLDTIKLRVEKTVIRKIPTEAFYYLVDLKYLWVTYNSITSIDSSSFYNLKQLHELRLDGNMISVFPWESLLEMPRLRTLDLHNNKIASIPAEAARYLKNITYLDVSSNKLTTLPSDLLDIWPPFSEPVSRNTEMYAQRAILGLQDNPWFCDCRISKLIELSKIVDPQVIFLDPFVVCSGPESLTGILFQKAELEQCLKPSVMTSATKITSPLGSNVLLRCDATGYPTPQLLWSRVNNTNVNYTVIRESPTDGVRWSILSMNGISYRDAGEYRCKAKNLAGISEASITVIVVGVVTTTLTPQRFGRRPEADQVNNMQSEEKEETATISTIWSPEILTSTSLLTDATVEPTIAPTTATSTTVRILERKPQKTKGQSQAANKKFQVANSGNKEEVLKNISDITETNAVVRNLKVTTETEERVTLTWRTLNTTNSSSLTVLYSKYGEEGMLRLSTDPSKNKVTIDGLQPGTKYMACVCPKAAQPKKDQCIVFSTDYLLKNEEESSFQMTILIVASSIACVIVVPIIFFLLYKVVKLQRKPQSPNAEDLLKETYVKFETLSLRPRSIHTGGELWTRRDTTESERLLLCSRSSMDSQGTFSEGSRPEYYC